MANEKRLIDANALCDKLQAHHDFFVNAWGSFSNLPANDKARVDEITNCIDVVVNAPTVDAVEVVHARWENMYGGKYANPRYRCSHCKEKANYKIERDMLSSWHEVQAMTPICHNCGARMDGEEKNSNLLFADMEEIIDGC